MNPVSGEKPPFSSSSRSQSWRGVRSQDGQSRDAAFSSAARSGRHDEVDEAAAVGRVEFSGHGYGVRFHPGRFQKALSFV